MEEEEVAAAAAAGADGSESGLEPLSSVLAREQADGIIADASSPAVQKWTVGRESSASSGPEEGEEDWEEDDGGFGGAMAEGAGAGSRTLGKQKQTKKGKNPGTPKLEATSSLFADFAFDGLATTRDAYGRDITPTKPTAPAALPQSGLPHATPPPVAVKARVRAAAAMPAASAAAGAGAAAAGPLREAGGGGAGAAEYTLRAEC